MLTIPWGALVLLVLAAFAGGVILRGERPACQICSKPLARVCPGGRCADLPKPARIATATATAVPTPRNRDEEATDEPT